MMYVAAGNQAGKTTLQKQLNQLEQLVRAAEYTGIRYRTRRGAWKWEITPVEYLQLTRQLADGPAWVLEQVRIVTGTYPASDAVGGDV